MILYKMGKRGETRVWEIKPISSTVFECIHGIEGGEMQSSRFNVYEKSSRTLCEQMELEIRSKIELKKNNGYLEKKEQISHKITNQLGLPKQMKAKPIVQAPSGPRVAYGRYTHVQPKLDGHRCSIALLGGALVAYSSGGKQITSIQHILNEVSITEGMVLDGELYIHGVSLQVISGKVRRQKEQSPDLLFMIFDQISNDPFAQRIESIPHQNGNSCKIVETKLVSCFDDVKTLFLKYRGGGYEGAMLRHGTTGYESGRRSSSIYKIKRLDGVGYHDDEFKVSSIISSSEGWAILVCDSKCGKFKVSCHGNFMYKVGVLKNREKYIGKMITVEYPNLTDSGIPSQPIAKGWREEE